ncbi:MAG: hypothetical protein OXG92_07885 [Chloroflexi bacterium]|nr:hypothetical protein [Chloroflexota bacterium]MCY3581333.1 hypothetical protein [Chloroflexota bacterium]MCY3716370.1 hypothetical protein [Chloroflexota bacterium]MDE2649430.1 hypothetical protein [Chloroflexota bacterium]MXX81863.1 hypothetical protein [Chloroflexota bacterium]
MIANMLNRRGERSAHNALESADSEGRGVLLAALLMMLVGWLGLAALVATTRPRVGGEIWLFFVLLQIAVTGSAIPFFRMLDQVLAPSRPPLTGVILRRSVWLGILAVLCAWLMIPRYLTLPIAFMLALLFFVLEVFLRSRELANEA